MGEIEAETFLFEQPAGVAGFAETFLLKIDISPAGEPVLLVPETLAMPQQHDFFHGNMQ